MEKPYITVKGKVLKLFDLPHKTYEVEMKTVNIIIKNLNENQKNLLQMAKNATAQKTASKAIFQILSEYMDLKKKIYSNPYLKDEKIIKDNSQKVIKRRKSTGIQIGDAKFKTKDHAVKYFSTILNNHKMKDKIYSLKLFDLIELHPDAKRKIGVGIDYFYIDYSPDWKASKCFWLCRKDGTVEDFSFMKIIQSYRSK